MTFHRERPAWLEDGEDLPEITPAIIASDQVIEACMALDRTPGTFTRWPFRDVDAMTGPMAPGNIWFVVAASGGGKTTFVASIIDLWQRAGTKVYVMALETRAYEFRTYLACMAVDFPPGEALSGNLASWPNGAAVRDVIKAALFDQTKKPYVEHVMVSGRRAIDLKGLEEGMKEAKAFGADVVIVDHIDHLESGDKGLYESSKHVNDGALRLAQDNDMLLVFTSQLNQSATKGDYLARYLPPKDEHVLFGALKRRNATGMIGLFRPIRSRRPDELEDEYLKSIRKIRSGEKGDVAEALEPNTMGVVAMKLRNFGSREGSKVLLGVKHGRVHDLAEKDRYQTEFGGRTREVYGR